MRGEPYELRCVPQAELVLDILPVGFDGFDTQVQVVPDHAAAQTCAEHPKDLQFAVREPLDLAVAGAASRDDVTAAKALYALYGRDCLKYHLASKGVAYA